MSANQALEKLLLSLFSADELRRFLRYLPDGESIDRRLPGAHASPAQLVNEAIAVLERDGLLVDPTLWERMISERPRRKSEIDGVRDKFKVGGDAGKQHTIDPPPPSTRVITVLLVSSSPDGVDRVRVDREFKEIIKGVRGTTQRDRLHFVQVQAVTFAELRTALLQHKPHVLHISSHGMKDGALVFENSAGEPEVVSKTSLLRLLTALRKQLRLILINACYSHSIAAAIPPTIDLAIGMNEAVVDKAAIEFGVAFYEALGFNESIETAFDAALAGLGDVDYEIPQLYPPADADPDGKRQLKLLES